MKRIILLILFISILSIFSCKKDVYYCYDCVKNTGTGYIEICNLTQNEINRYAGDYNYTCTKK